MVTRNSSQQEVVEYLREKCSTLIKGYSSDTFNGVDGEVFLGLTPATIDMVFPQLSQRDKGLLLSRVEYLRQSSDSPTLPVRDVTPPPSFHRAALPSASVESNIELHDTRPLGRIDEGRFSTQYRRSFSPTRSRAPWKGRDDASPLVAPITGELPRILIELWRSTDDPDKDEFLAESWLPDLKELELKAQTLRLALRRSIKKKDARITLTRSWLGALVVTARYHRIGNRLELHLTQAKELNVSTHSYSEFFAKLYTYETAGPSLTLVRETNRYPASMGSSCVDFDEQLTLRFGRADDPAAKVAAAAAPLRSPKQASLGVESAEVLRTLMLRTSHEEGDKKYESLLSLYDLLSLAAKGSVFKLDPRFNRFESHLLPTHELSALSGAQFTFRSVAQIDILKRDSDYMRSHTQVIELLLVIWGLSEAEKDQLEQGVWAGDSWLFRHALLSAIVLDNRPAVRTLIKASKILIENRLLDLAETGFGEALFTLQRDMQAARTYWESPKRQTGIRSPYLPEQRATLGSLLGWIDEPIFH